MTAPKAEFDEIIHCPIILRVRHSASFHYCLAILYSEGIGFPRSETAAARWLCKAAPRIDADLQVLP